MAQFTGRKNWRVRFYDKNNKILRSFRIKDRTEHEAEKEATAQLTSDVDDWTMMPIAEKK
jgi:hypothetical protein